MKKLLIPENEKLFNNNGETEEIDSDSKIEFIYRHLYSYKFHAFLNMMTDLTNISN